MGRYENCTYFDTLYEAMAACFPEVSRQDAKTVLRELILAPDDYTVEFGGKTYDKLKISTMLARQLTQSCVKETPQQTYNDIIESAAEIIKHMNDGYITDEDYDERQAFLQTIDRYEFTLFTAYCLLNAIGEVEAMQIDEIVLNIVRLREIRDLIANYTRDEKGVMTERDEFERAKPIYRMLKSLQSLGYDYNFSPKERESLGIDHEDDDDLSDRFNHGNWLKRIMLLQLRKETAEKPVVTPISNVENASKRDVMIDEKIAKLRGIYSQRGFDKNRFNVLNNSAKAPPVSGEDNV